MTQEIINVHFNPDAERDISTQQRLNALEKYKTREGHIKVTLFGEAPTPTEVKACPICTKPCAMSTKGFLCQKCVMFFW